MIYQRIGGTKTKFKNILVFILVDKKALSSQLVQVIYKLNVTSFL